MNGNNRSRWRRGALGGALLAAAALAQAQYAWIDDKGLKQYSDRPPEPALPAARILKAPGLAPRQETDAGEQARQPPGAAPTTAEREAAFRKRKAEQAALARTADDEARRRAERDSNCARQRQHLQLLESGIRIGTVNQQGERDFINDAERAGQIAQIRRALAGCA